MKKEIGEWPKIWKHIMTRIREPSRSEIHRCVSSNIVTHIYATTRIMVEVEIADEIHGEVGEQIRGKFLNF